MAITVFTTPAQVRDFTRGRQRERHTLALVPTMGFLHEGHLSLMRAGRTSCDITAVTIFVNPTQFGPTEDLSRYPRDVRGDLAKCEAAGVGFAYLPEPSSVYPPGYQTYVDVERVSQGLCGGRRPGHFRGVATVVTKFLSLFRPELALFGEKDYQQLMVIKALARDLELDVEVAGLPTVREGDGLAMSSRNSYLSASERAQALSLSRGLFGAQRALTDGLREAAQLVGLVRAELKANDVREDYVELRDAETLEPLTAVAVGQTARLLVAGFVGQTRLIDNIALNG